MIPSELHKEVHTALLRRKSLGDLWGSPLNNGYVGLVLCFHAERDEVIIGEIAGYFERNLNAPEFLNDSRALAGAALYSGVLGKTGQRVKGTEAARRVEVQVSTLLKKQFWKYSLLNQPELVYFVVIGLKQSGADNLRGLAKVIAPSVQNSLGILRPDNIQRIAFFLAAAMELGLNVKQNLSGLLTGLDMTRLRAYDITPLVWLLMRYRDEIAEQLGSDSYLKGLLSHHSESAWKLLESQKPVLSFSLPPTSIDEEAGRDGIHVLSVLELAMLDDFLAVGELARGVYPPDLYSMLGLHSEIRKQTEKLFKEGNYNQAISEAFMLLVNMVKDKAGRPKSNDGKELDGVDLMNQVFSPKNPILRFNDGKTQTDDDEQLGFMNLFSGSVSAVRNVFHHSSMEKQEDPYVTIQYLELASLLAGRLDRAKKVR